MLIIFLSLKIISAYRLFSVNFKAVYSNGPLLGFIWLIVCLILLFVFLSYIVVSVLELATLYSPWLWVFSTNDLLLIITVIFASTGINFMALYILAQFFITKLHPQLSAMGQWLICLEVMILCLHFLCSYPRELSLQGHTTKLNQ